MTLNLEGLPPWLQRAAKRVYGAGRPAAPVSIMHPRDYHRAKAFDEMLAKNPRGNGDEMARQAYIEGDRRYAEELAHPPMLGGTLAEELEAGGLKAAFIDVQHETNKST